jgi:hypothetical protein
MRWQLWTGLLRGVLALAVITPAIIAAQTPAPAGGAEKMVAPAMAAFTRYAEKLEVPRAGKASVKVQAELGSWVSIKRAREITVPPQGFYLATLSNGTAVTVIKGEEKLRKAGEIWAVPDGQSMTVKIQVKRQETVGLEIFSLGIGH